MRYKTKSGLDQHISHIHSYAKEESPLIVQPRPELLHVDSAIDNGAGALQPVPAPKVKVKNPVC